MPRQVKALCCGGAELVPVWTPTMALPEFRGCLVRLGPQVHLFWVAVDSSVLL